MISKYFDRIISLIGVIAVLFLLFKSCNLQENYADIVHSDTTIEKKYYIKDTIIYNVPIVTHTVHDTLKIKETEYIPDANYEKLSQQFTELRDKYLASNIVNDSVSLNDLGYVKIEDTVKSNKITGRKISPFITFPKEVITVTKRFPLAPKNIWMYGFNLQGNKDNYIQQVNANIMLVNKKRNGFQIGIGIDNNKNINYTGGVYFKF